MKYKEAIKNLFPRGRLWTFPPGGVLDNLINGTAQELLRIESRAKKLQDEADPRTSSESLVDWERVLGLPGHCETLPTNADDRRNQIVSQLLKTGPQTRTFFVELAQSLGYEDVTVSDIEPFHAFRVEESRVEQPLVEASVGWVFAFRINVNEVTIRPFRVETHRVESRLAEFSDELLECVIGEAKEAHTIVLFRYPS